MVVIQIVVILVCSWNEVGWTSFYSTILADLSAQFGCIELKMFCRAATCPSKRLGVEIWFGMHKQIGNHNNKSEWSLERAPGKGEMVNGTILRKKWGSKGYCRKLCYISRFSLPTLCRVEIPGWLDISTCLIMKHYCITLSKVGSCLLYHCKLDLQRDLNIYVSWRKFSSKAIAMWTSRYM